MEHAQGLVLAVDDEPVNLEILTDYLREKGYAWMAANNGMEAWRLLQATPDAFDAVLLGRIMPGMDGLAVLEQMKQHEQLRAVPVVVQTARTSREEVLEGLQAGAYYYLTKPYDRDALLAILATAVSDHRRYRGLQEQAQRTARTLTLLQEGRFVFRTLDEARDLAALLASAGSARQRLVIGLSELLINAVEHGNLGISYTEKSLLNARRAWRAEVERRLLLPENIEKCVTVEFSNNGREQRFLIRDQGKGFDWGDFLEIHPDRVFDSHGRGIAMARAFSFDHLEYHGCGNEVLAVVQT